MSLTRDPISLILLPTLECNAACEYCFEDKSRARLSHEQLAVIIDKICTYMVEQGIVTLAINWQGGEVMVLPPSWFEEAGSLIQEIARSHNREVEHYIQSNLIGYSREWLPVLTEMFNSSIGSSLDFPNLYRKLPGGGPEQYKAIMERRIRQVQEDSLDLGIIALPNEETFAMGAARFYDYYVKHLHLKSFQINTPFAGGTDTPAKSAYPLDNERLTAFLLELIDIWMAEGYAQGVRISPFEQLLNYFLDREQHLLCIWGENCANEFFCVDPLGNLSQCDCWAASYPAFHFGNLLEPGGLGALLTNTPARNRFLERPAALMAVEDCLDCAYLALCHGGCPVRAYTMNHDIRTKDPYCPTYKALFSRMEQVAAHLAAQGGCLPVSAP